MKRNLMIKVQFGCGLSNPAGWRNFDSTPTLFARKIPFAATIAGGFLKIVGNKKKRFSLILRNIIHSKAEYGDIVKGLPLQSASVDVLYGSHVLEHLPVKEFRIALKECKRILRDEGILRVVVPNLRFFVDEYLESSSPTKSIDFSLDTGMGSESFANPLSRMRGDSHHVMYDAETMLNELRSAGFPKVRQAYFGDSECAEFSEVEDQGRWTYPLCIGFECSK